MDDHQMVMLPWLLLLLIVAAGFDLRQRRIPNAIPLCILLIAIALLLLAPGAAFASGWGAGLAGLGLGAVLMLPGYLARALGAGDVKRMAAVGFALGWPLALPLVLATALAMGLLALLAWLTGRRGRQPAAPAMLLGTVVALAMRLT